MTAEVRAPFDLVEMGRRELTEKFIANAHPDSIVGQLFPRPDLTALRAEAARLDDAYTQAIRDAAQTGNWYGVPAYAHAAQQARAALREAAEENQT